MKKMLYFALLSALLISFSGCGGDDDNPVPVLTSLSPSYSVTRMPDFTLHAIGSNFIQDSKINFNGQEKATTYVSSTELTCTITTSEISSLAAGNVEPGIGEGGLLGDSYVNVSVTNPSPGGGQSDNIRFQITSTHSFATPKNLSQTSADSDSPQIIVDNSGNINAFWRDYQTSIVNPEIYMVRSTDNGTNWGSQINISQTSDVSVAPAAAVDISNNINVVWQEWIPTSTQYDICFRRSTSAGSSWSETVNVSNTVWTSSLPTIAVDTSGIIYLAWLERVLQGGVDKYTIYFSKSSDGGSTWASPVTIVDMTCESQIKMAISNLGILAVAWRSGDCTSKGDIYVSSSINQGGQWSTPVNVSNSSASDSTTPDITFDYGGTIIAAWKDEVSGNAEIFFSKSPDYGATWTTPVNISNTSGFSRSPSLKVDLVGNINCVWMDRTTGNNEIYYSRSTDSGSTWTTAVNISNMTDESQNPKISVNSVGYIFILWVDRYPGNPEIYFNRSKISGID